LSDVAIRVAGIGKRYQIRRAALDWYLRDALASAAAAGLRRFRGAGWHASCSPAAGRAREDEFVWAVRDVSFEMRQGEVVGIIGRNGAGKSTLLRMLARITAPTAGHAEVYGRVGTLLEVGIGFHPELTGRENIYLNGAIIGMKQAEIARKFDEIVSFADVNRFLDTPIKHYSSGMYVRLAFAVAAHLDSDILLVDEVLAVGDSHFQRKCLGKMNDAARSGRTVLFITHQLSQLRRLCQRVVWLDGGRVRAIGDTASVVARYEEDDGLPADGGQQGRQCFLRWELAGGGHAIRDGSEPVAFCVIIRLTSPIVTPHVVFKLYDEQGVLVGNWATDGLSLSEGAHELLMELPELPVRPGTYSLRCSIFDGGRRGRRVDAWEAVPPLRVESVALGQPLQDGWGGVLNVPASMSVRPARLRAQSGATAPVAEVR
jgi:homopolymeric O-antigen transport system ATP-binding protein